MICDPLSSQTKHSRQASQGILSHEAAHHKEHTLMFDAFLTIATHRGLRRVEGVSGGGGIRTHDSGHRVYGGLPASPLCSKTTLDVYKGRLLSIVVYRLCCQFCCQQGSAGGKSACEGRDLQEPVTENTNGLLLEPVKRGSSRKYWKCLSLGIRHQQASTLHAFLH